MDKLTHLGQLSLEDFFRDYWQKKPCLLKNALPDWQPLLTPDELAGLAMEDAVESRLVFEQLDGKPWQLKAGPFSEQDFNQLPAQGWTLLVQAVDHWLPGATALLDRFRFIPNWRLDDLMVSFAPDGGSVGPHFDHYDVFLIQGYGNRHWKIGQHCDEQSAKVADTPLNILQAFEESAAYDLQPGDILYLPPGLAHWGIARGESMTYSVGFRAPAHGEILDDFAAEVCAGLSQNQRLVDNQVAAARQSGLITDDTLQALQNIIHQHLDAPEALAQWFGKFMTEQKYDVDGTLKSVEPDPDTLAEAQACLAEYQGPLFQAPDARFAWRGDNLFVNGQQFRVQAELAAAIADYRAIENWQAWRDDPVLARLLALQWLWLEDPRLDEDE